MDAFAALADSIRRQIITRLTTASVEISAGEIADAFAITPSAVSQHLKVLKEAGLVRVRIEGQRRLYRLVPARFEEIQTNGSLSPQLQGRLRGLSLLLWMPLILSRGLTGWMRRRFCRCLFVDLS